MVLICVVILTKLGFLVVQDIGVNRQIDVCRVIVIDYDVIYNLPTSNTVSFTLHRCNFHLKFVNPIFVRMFIYSSQMIRKDLSDFDNLMCDA